MTPEAATPRHPSVADPAPVRVEERCPPEAWDRYVEANPASTLFHGRAWQRVLERSFPYRPCHRVALRGETVVGVLPLYRVPGLPRGHSLVSTPLAVYGGVCADDDEAARALLEDAEALARRQGSRYVELRHERAIGALPTKDLYVTFRRPILPDREGNLALVPRNQRRSIRVAEKHGLTARVGGEDLLAGFYDVYSESVRNLGSPVFPRALFASLLEEYGTRCRILAVFHEGRMVSGVLTLFHRDQVMPYYGGSTREGIQVAANDFMYWSLLCHGAEEGYRVFDFGRSKRDTGAYHFKRHWGFEPTPLAYQYQLVGQRELPNLSPANPKFDLAIRVWRRLPLKLTQWLGPRLVRYFP